jgi:hypothetical protein
MTSIKLTSGQVEMAREMAEKVGRSVVVEGMVLRFDAEDAAELLVMATHAESYWLSRKKRGQAKVACSIREKLAEIVANERYLRSFMS